MSLTNVDRKKLRGLIVNNKIFIVIFVNFPRNWRRFNPLVMQIVDTFEFDMEKIKGFTINYHTKQE